MDGGEVQDGAGYGDLAGTESRERSLGKFSVQLSESMGEIISEEAQAHHEENYCIEKRGWIYLRFAGSPLFLQL